MPWASAPRPSCQRVEIVEQRGDATAVPLIHDGAGAARGGDQLERADTLLDAWNAGRRHRQLAQAEAGGQRGEARVARHLAAHADRDAGTVRRLAGELDETQHRRVERAVEIGDLLVPRV